MWMEETIGERINVNRTQEAVATGADEIAVGCPFCNVMLSDGLTAEQAAGRASEDVKIIDVAQMLLASVKRGQVGADVAGAADEGPAVIEDPPLAEASVPAGGAPTEAITAAAVGAGATEALAGDSSAEPATPEVVPAEPIAAEAVAPHSAEAQKAHEDFAKEAPMADEVDSAAAVPDNSDDTDETPAEHLMEHNADLEPTDEDARDEEADELKHEHEHDGDEPTQA
jgi:hypothetical protein